ncbi:MAG TPA: 4'-phosphopantetheinyl transferase superfamily protein [Planctomycetota bacterium]|nr:4'-phosphopantetheinyl transferase superfamily protein [Planctomycetota bacterium]
MHTQPLLTGQVHVWSASLVQDPSVLAKLHASLCADELARAGAFRFDVHRRRYSCGRGILRSILSAYLRTDAASLRFTYSATGRPSLNGAELEFNLAHSDDVLLIALSGGLRLGIDVECVRALSDMSAVARRVFSPGECAYVFRDGTPDPRRFFRCWTRKEALLKASGCGLQDHLAAIEVLQDQVTFDPQEDGCCSGSFGLCDVESGNDCAAALAVLGPAPEILNFTWHEGN